MNSKQRLVSFFAAMLITFGLTSLDLDNPAFDDNLKSYIGIALGVVLFIIFIFLRKNSPKY